MRHAPQDPALRRLLDSVNTPPVPDPPAPPGLNVHGALIGQLVGQVNGPMVITAELSASALEALLKPQGGR